MSDGMLFKIVVSIAFLVVGVALLFVKRGYRVDSPFQRRMAICRPFVRACLNADGTFKPVAKCAIVLVYAVTVALIWLIVPS